MGRVLKMHFSARFCRNFAGLFATLLALICLASCGGSSSSTPSPQSPTITTQPAGATISSGQTVNLRVTATGATPLSYQWYRGSSGDTTTPVGTNSSSDMSPPLNASTNYWVKVSNSAGSTNSATAAIIVVTPPPNAIPSSFLGMHMNGGTISRQPWPVAPFGAVRLWDAGVSWADLMPNGPTQPNWSNLDKWLSLIPMQDPSADILYTFGRTAPGPTSTGKTLSPRS
jgi:hypothetical protein